MTTGRDWADVTTAGDPWESPEAGRNKTPPWRLQGHTHLSFELLTSRIMRIKTVLSQATSLWRLVMATTGH